MATNAPKFGPQPLMGPFAEVLTTPAAGVPERQPSGYMGNVGAVSMIASRFIRGLAEGRLHKAAIEERRRQENLQTIDRLEGMLAGLAPDAANEARSILTKMKLRQAGYELNQQLKEDPEKKKHPVMRVFSTVINTLAGPLPKKVEKLNYQDLQQFLKIVTDPKNRVDVALKGKADEISQLYAKERERLGRTPTVSELMLNPRFATTVNEYVALGGQPGLTPLGWLEKQPPVDKSLIGLFNALSQIEGKASQTAQLGTKPLFAPQVQQAEQIGAAAAQPAQQSPNVVPQAAPQAVREATGGPPPPPAQAGQPTAPPAGGVPAAAAPTPPAGAVQPQEGTGVRELKSTLLENYLISKGYLPKPEYVYLADKNTGRTIGQAIRRGTGLYDVTTKQPITLPENVIVLQRPWRPEAKRAFGVRGTVYEYDPNTGDLRQIATAPEESPQEPIRDVLGMVSRTFDSANNLVARVESESLFKPGTAEYEVVSQNARMASAKIKADAISRALSMAQTERQKAALLNMADEVLSDIEGQYSRYLYNIRDLVERGLKESRATTPRSYWAKFFEEAKDKDKDTAIAERSWDLFKRASQAIYPMARVTPQRAQEIQVNLFRQAWPLQAKMFLESKRIYEPYEAVKATVKQFVASHGRLPRLDELGDALRSRSDVVALVDEQGRVLSADSVLRLFKRAFNEVRDEGAPVATGSVGPRRMTHGSR